MNGKSKEENPLKILNRDNVGTDPHVLQEPSEEDVSIETGRERRERLNRLSKPQSIDNPTHGIDGPIKKPVKKY